MNPPYSRSRPKVNPFRELYTRPEKTRKRRSFFGGILRFVLLVILACGAGTAGIVCEGYLYFTHNLPSIEKLKNYSPPIVTAVYAANGELVAEFASQRRFVVPIEKIPKMLQDAFVAAEDKNFWEHSGVDKKAIVRAIKINLMSGRVAIGASTITQQVAKMFLLTPEKKFVRKIKEAILSTRIERSLSKKQILYLYLNEINLGSSAYGVESAAQTYFGKHVGDLTVAECAMLAGLTQAPTKKSPKNNLKAALERRAYVLSRMLEDGYITQETYEQAMQEEPKLVARSNLYKTRCPDFAEHVRRYIEKKYGSDVLYREGLQVHTTVDLEMTRLAEKAVDKGLRDLDKRQGYRGPLKTLNVKGVMEFLEAKTRAMEAPLRFGDIVEGVITHLDDRYISVRMGSYIKGDVKREYVGRVEIDRNPKWWGRKPYIRPQMRARNFSEGDLPFQVGDVVLVRLVDPNESRRELYLKKYGDKDPQLKNYKQYTEDMVSYFPLEVEQEPLVESALMLRENRTGYVRVLVGGRSFSEANYNRATQARRQPGSSFKPVIFAAALNKGFTCGDVILDSPLALSIPGTGEVWRPKNYRGGHSGPVTFREALVKSINIPTIKILQQIGIEHAKAYARKLGYGSPLANNLTMALGSTGVSLEEQLNAFSVFPNRGYLIPGVYITRIVDRTGKVLEEHPPPVLLDDPSLAEPPQVRRVSHNFGVPAAPAETPEKGSAFIRRSIDEGTAYIMTSLMQDVIRHGTATVLKNIVGRPDIAGKTGTTNECIDAWFMGFTPNYTCGVWVGFDDEQSLGPAETGGKAAAPIWGYFMRDVLAGSPIKEFPPPQSVEFRNIDPRTGLATASPGGFREVFKKGSGPGDVETTVIKGTRWDYAGSDLDQF